ncbi:uncharacterized protein LOC117321973 [Pecten maximus]|uniref:uncharacterized protein LOC117321973 n=1 Tax=Pecten maximus TaxID=6579 RepID=UPI0014585913|nr:uncharacterized protein LOC117321973 [Pecten maximus]
MTRIQCKDLTPAVGVKYDAYTYVTGEEGEEEESEASVPLSKCCQRGEVFHSTLCIMIVILTAVSIVTVFKACQGELTVKNAIYTTIIIGTCVVAICVTIGYRPAGHQDQMDSKQRDERSPNSKDSIKKMIQKIQKWCVGTIKRILGNRTQRTMVALPTLYPNHYWKVEGKRGCHSNDASTNNRSWANQQRSSCQNAIPPESYV